MIPCNVSGPLGVLHLPRLWLKVSLESRGKLADGYPGIGKGFDQMVLDGLGLEAQDDAAVGAAGALLRYLKELQPAGLPHLARPQVERAGGTMPLDEMTRRNLELVESLRGGSTEGTLLSVLDRTKTPMGARLLKRMEPGGSISVEQLSNPDFEILLEVPWK